MTAVMASPRTTRYVSSCVSRTRWSTAARITGIASSRSPRPATVDPRRGDQLGGHPSGDVESCSGSGVVRVTDANHEVVLLLRSGWVSAQRDDIEVTITAAPEPESCSGSEGFTRPFAGRFSFPLPPWRTAPDGQRPGVRRLA
jgi:hypothetical protein